MDQIEEMREERLDNPEGFVPEEIEESHEETEEEHSINYDLTVATFIKFKLKD